MRKRITGVLLLLVMLGMLPVLHALSMPSLPYDASTVLSDRTISAQEQSLRELLYPMLLAHEAEITLPIGTSYALASQTIEGMMQDYPELFSLADTYKIVYERSDPDTAKSLKPTYRCTLEEAEALRVTLLATAQRWTQESKDPLVLHDRLVQNTAYNNESQWCATAVGALLEGQANCQGYAQAINLLYRMADIPSGLVTGVATDWQGQTLRHAWNLVDDGGLWLLDATWNDQGSVNTHWYYGLSEAEMAVDHQAENVLPETVVGHSYHERFGLTAETEAELASFLRLLAQGETINLHLSDSLYSVCRADFAAVLTRYNESAKAEERFVGSYYLVVSDARRCIYVMPGA